MALGAVVCLFASFDVVVYVRQMTSESFWCAPKIAIVEWRVLVAFGVFSLWEPKSFRRNSTLAQGFALV